MPDAPKKPMSAVEAARLIYRTKSPTDQQIGRVYERMKAGAIQVNDDRRAPLDWTTTEAAVADYLAAEMVKRQLTPPSADVPIPRAVRRPQRAIAAPSKRRAEDAQTLRGVYHGIWRDYFLAVMLRRRIAHRSVAFRRAVLAGQIAALLSLAGSVGLVVRISSEPVLPERAAVARWIDDNTDEHRITRWHPTRPADDGQGSLVEVEYRYRKDSLRTIHTERTFRVVEGTVREVGPD